ncbi:unnamed protein product [Mytilus coruscus]|uniref:Uncharacterized protein n=1 Tax=Mytilus coruscus TaxID=42192 RepID=A0A6J8ESU1_MYTCO|nr:unnamed protein product [Mytilus coruscus]
MDMMLIFEKSTRAGVAMMTQIHSKAYNAYMVDYDKTQTMLSTAVSKNTHLPGDDLPKVIGKNLGGAFQPSKLTIIMIRHIMQSFLKTKQNANNTDPEHGARYSSHSDPVRNTHPLENRKSSKVALIVLETYYSLLNNHEGNNFKYSPNFITWPIGRGRRRRQDQVEGLEQLPQRVRRDPREAAQQPQPVARNLKRRPINVDEAPIERRRRVDHEFKRPELKIQVDEAQLAALHPDVNMQVNEPQLLP